MHHSGKGERCSDRLGGARRIFSELIFETRQSPSRLRRRTSRCGAGFGMVWNDKWSAPAGIASFGRRGSGRDRWRNGRRLQANPDANISPIDWSSAVFRVLRSRYLRAQGIGTCSVLAIASLADYPG